MSNWNPAVWRAAQQIETALTSVRSAESLPLLPLDTANTLRPLKQRWESVQQREWRVAARHVRQTLRSRVSALIQDLQRFLNESSRRAAEPVATAGDLYRDLIALTEEFHDVAIDRDERTVSATTDWIVLDHVDLGPFRIVWCWDRRDEEDELRVIAEEPHPAQRDEDVPHPHVRGESLCPGEATVPLERALRAGRLYDAFLIVRQVLQTYNSGSAYVSLSEWEGVRCYGCGDSVSDDDVSGCESCGAELCPDCRDVCHVCEAALCQTCAVVCTGCLETVCATCRPLHGSRRSSLCPACHAKETHEVEETNPADENPAPATTTSVAVHSGELGETPVPA